MTIIRGARAIPWPYALVSGFTALFALGTVTAALRGGLPVAGVIFVAAVIVTLTSFGGEPATAAPIAVIGWLTAIGFSRPPYAQLRLGGPVAGESALVMALSAVAGLCAGVLYRSARQLILEAMEAHSGSHLARAPGQAPAAGASAIRQRPLRLALSGTFGDAIDVRRRLLGIALAASALPLLTMALLAARPSLSLTDDLLIYLVAVVALAVIGGFWPAVLAAAAASMLLNWYFTPPLRTFSIDKPENLLALLLFVTVAVMVSSVVHLAGRRAVQSARSRAEATSLLALAQTVLGGADTPGAVLDHLTETMGGHARLLEEVQGRWVPIASSGAAADPEPTRLVIRSRLALEVAGQPAPVAPGLLAGFAAQAAAALDRDRLRTQAAQAEALAEGNRMRTALLAAVSHDLRTPLASIKASVSSLRQTDVKWTPADQAVLLATIEQNADRLDGLIGNLLDMSRLHTGSLQPFLRSTAVDEVAPVALRGLDAPGDLRMDVPDGLPLVLADPGLLERVLANLFSNALRHSPAGSPPALQARRAGGAVTLEVVDHGPGVPDDLKERIFEPFQRFDGRKAGVGLGLAVAKGFTEAMGGSIAALNTPGGGLTVAVTLPVAGVERATATRGGS